MFLDVNIEKPDEGNLCTCVFEKYTDISNSHLVILYHVKWVSHTAKVNGIDKSLQMMTILNET